MSDLVGEVATHRSSKRHAVRFAAVDLVVSHEAGWRGATIVLHREDGGEAEFPCASLSAVSAGGASFAVTVDADGKRHGPYRVEGLVSGFPAGADCYLFRRRDDGFWDGVTVTAAHRRVVIEEYACDPA